MTECERYAEALEKAEDTYGVISMSTEVRDILVQLLRGIPEKPAKPIFMPGHLFACPRCTAIVKLGNSFCWNCGRSVKQSCSECPWMGLDCNDRLHLAALELLKQPVDKKLHLADLDTLVNMIATKAKAEGRFFSPYEVGLALVQRGQHDKRFKWGEVIKYSPSEVEQILNEVMQDGS